MTYKCLLLHLQEIFHLFLQNLICLLGSHLKLDPRNFNSIISSYLFNSVSLRFAFQSFTFGFLKFLLLYHFFTYIYYIFMPLKSRLIISHFNRNRFGFIWLTFLRRTHFSIIFGRNMATPGNSSCISYLSYF